MTEPHPHDTRDEDPHAECRTEIERLEASLKAAADDAHAHLMQGEVYRNRLTKMAQLSDKERLRAEKAERERDEARTAISIRRKAGHNDWCLISSERTNACNCGHEALAVKAAEGDE